MRALTEAHKIAQGRLAARTVEQLHVVWPTLDPANVDATTKAWLAKALPVIAAHHDWSARLAAAYLTRFRTIKVGSSAPLPPRPPLNLDAVTTSLMVTGPVALKKAIDRGEPDTAEASSSAAGMRHALSGGRDLILATALSDDRSQGWERVTSPGACDFCESIAADGPFGPGADFQAHDGCNCTPEPVYGN